MRAGKLDRAITLQRASRAVSTTGTVTETWADLATVRAELITTAAAELDRAFGEAELSATRFSIRYIADLTTADRVLYAGVAFDLIEITELGRRRSLELRCERSRR